MEKVYICSSFRTPIGAFGGQYNSTPASKLGSLVLSQCLQRAEIPGEDVSQVIMGQTLVAGQGQNPARQASVYAKIPLSVPASTINMACGSGLKAVFIAYDEIRAGESKIILAGGQDSVSTSHHILNLKTNKEKKKIGHIQALDTAIIDGITCALLKSEFGVIAENMASAFDISRKVQEKFAVMSHIRALKALDNGYFLNELTAHETHFDECARKEINLATLSKLPPLFEGTITSGTSAELADGAAAILLCSGTEVVKRNLYPQAIILGTVEYGCDPLQMGLAPIAAIKKLVEKISWNIKEVDLFEINESFGVLAMICANVLNVDFAKVNVCGGALALGNPLAASGARILVTLVHNLERLEKNKGIAAMCVGGGFGLAIAVQRCQGAGLHAIPLSSGLYEGQNLSPRHNN